MRKVNVKSLVPGMKVGADVFSGDIEPLLKSGVTLTSGYIKKLVDLGIPFIYINDGLVQDLKVNDVVTSETRMAAVEQVKNVLVKTKDAGKLVIEPKALYSTVRQFTDELLSCKSLVMNLVDLRTQDNYTFAHSVNVCILAMMTGISLGYTKDQLDILGVGALLHDLGKVKIPDSILNKPGKLTPEEFAIIKNHPTYSNDLIRSSRSLEEVHAQIAYQHHENYDGSGYPLGITGDEITEYAQIISIADRFDALTADRVYRKAFPAHEVYEMCAGSGDYLFSMRVVRAFLLNVAAYPTGTMVELNTGQSAVVLETPRGQAPFPKVRVHYDQYRNSLKLPFEIDLSLKKDIFIVKTMDGH